MTGLKKEVAKGNEAAYLQFCSSHHERSPVRVLRQLARVRPRRCRLATARTPPLQLRYELATEEQVHESSPWRNPLAYALVVVPEGSIVRSTEPAIIHAELRVPHSVNTAGCAGTRNPSSGNVGGG